MPRKAKVCAPYRLLLGSEAGLDPAAEMPERSQLSARTESPFASVLPSETREDILFTTTPPDADNPHTGPRSPGWRAPAAMEGPMIALEMLHASRI